MIKINRPNLADLAEEHWNLLNKKKKDSTYYKNSVVKKIDHNLNHLELSTIQGRDNLISIFRYFQENLKKIITGKPDELQNFLYEIENLMACFFSIGFINGLKGRDDNNIYSQYSLKKVFNYDNFSKTYGYQLSQKLSVNTCPYCNRNSTYTIIKGKKGKTRPELDHFFNKSDYPYLGLSFYNLIPSCHICNHIKSDKIFSLKDNIHPYVESFGEFIKFSIQPTDVCFIHNLPSKFSIKLKKANNLNPTDEEKFKRAKNNIDVLKIEDLLNEQKDYVSEIILKNHIYTEEYIDSIFSAYTNLFTKESDLMRVLLSNYVTDEELGKRPLAKLTKDIAEELGLI